ncbi:30S ribosomal protein S6 [Candidatus Microgenomates bacterium]|nr:30S ribosomal protein S6 [Candidatus Microgenomates bacterium]
MKYELMVILPSSVSGEEEKKIFAQIKKAALDLVKISEPKLFGKKTLVYPIKKIKEGNYYLFDVEGQIKPFSQKIQSIETILRYLIVKKIVRAQKE